MRKVTRSLRLSSKGQIVIPADVRRELRLKTGSTLRLRTTEAQEIVLSANQEDVDVESARRSFEAWCKTTGRDPVEELYVRRRKERAEEARKREIRRP